MSHTWLPVFPRSGSLAETAWTVIDSVCGDIERTDLNAARVPALYEAPLLYSYLALARDDDKWADRALTGLNKAIDAAPGLPNPALYSGLCGLGWTVEHISRRLLLQAASASVEAGDAGSPDSGDDDLNEQTDLSILARLQGKWTGSYDLISGLVGFGVYFLERWPAGKALTGILCVLNQLEDCSEESRDGLTWHTPPLHLPDWQRKRNRDGYYNLGVAHGVPGIVFFLNEVAALGIEADRCERLLERTVQWLLAQQHPAAAPGRFDSWLPPNEGPSPRLAWCYGDFGITDVLMRAAKRTGRKDWQSAADDILDHCLVRAMRSQDVGDAALCHGAAGVAHIFNRIYQSRGDERCRDAAVKWYEKTLSMRRPGLGCGGFLARTVPDHVNVVWDADPTFLSGSTGIALALISAVTPVEPAWDRLMLLS